MIEAFPLEWPLGFKRTKEPQNSSFKMSADKSRKALLNEIKLLSGDDKAIISSNVPVRKADGMMYSDVAKDQLHDSGVAVYFMYDGNQVVLACDAWLTPAENLRALSLTVEAIRGLERWKASEILSRTFTGLKALPEQSSFNEKSIWKILGLAGKPATIDAVHNAYKHQAKKLHPDAGGKREDFDQLQTAYRFAKQMF